MTYEDFIASKRRNQAFPGLIPSTWRSSLFPFQHQVTTWAIERGRAALWLDTGLGKTRQQLVWAQHVVEQAGDVLIFAPLSVAAQTQGEAHRIGLHVTIAREADDIREGINICNYERLHLMPMERFRGVVLDESSILKGIDGKTRRALNEACASIPYRLCCTATPAPNDTMELANHAEFLGVMSRLEMLSTYFMHDGGSTANWRLKRHAVRDFWAWVSTWAVALTHPLALGDQTPGYDLPPLTIQHHILQTQGYSEGHTLFPMEATTLTEQRAARRAGLSQRIEYVAKMVNAQAQESWLIWCDLNDEGDQLERLIPGSVQVAGKDHPDVKEARMQAFTEGIALILVSKVGICGLGMNWQHCHNVVFVGVSHSFEGWYQAIRRCWRFGQQHPVTVHMVFTDVEMPIVRNLERKRLEAEQMQHAMQEHLLSFFTQATRREHAPTQHITIPAWITEEA